MTIKCITLTRFRVGPSSSVCLPHSRCGRAGLQTAAEDRPRQAQPAAAKTRRASDAVAAGTGAAAHLGAGRPWRMGRTGNAPPRRPRGPHHLHPHLREKRRNAGPVHRGGETGRRMKDCRTGDEGFSAFRPLRGHPETASSESVGRPGVYAGWPMPFCSRSSAPFTGLQGGSTRKPHEWGCKNTFFNVRLPGVNTGPNKGFGSLHLTDSPLIADY